MSKKDEILEMIKDGASYDRVEQATGAERAYIRQIASNYRHKDDKKVEVSDEGKESVQKNSFEDKKVVIDKVDDSLEFDMGKEDKTFKGEGKSGLQHHKDWVAEKKYECTCGCTLNKKGDFCPHCGTTLDWEGVE